MCYLQVYKFQESWFLKNYSTILEEISKAYTSQDNIENQLYFSDKFNQTTLKNLNSRQYSAEDILSEIIRIQSKFNWEEQSCFRLILEKKLLNIINTEKIIYSISKDNLNPNQINNKFKLISNRDLEFDIWLESFFFNKIL